MNHPSDTGQAPDTNTPTEAGRTPIPPAIPDAEFEKLSKLAEDPRSLDGTSDDAFRGVTQ
jgi:hypothetical protein